MKRRTCVELTEDVLLLVLARLNVQDLCRCCCVSRYWRRVCGNKTLWSDVSLIDRQLVTHTRLLSPWWRGRRAGCAHSSLGRPACRACLKQRLLLSSQSRRTWLKYKVLRD